MKIYFILFLFISGFLLINSSKRKSNDDGDDEFAEFDDLLFEDEKPKAKVIQNDLKSQIKNNDFDELEVSVEDEDSDEFEELIEKKPKKPTIYTTAAPTTSTTKSPDNKQKEQQKFKQDNSDTLDLEEFENFVDEEEFEGFEESKQNFDEEFDSELKSSEKSSNTKKSDGLPNLTITSVPEHLMNTNSWKNYYLELIMIAMIIGYSTNIFIGKTKNATLANVWFESNRELLEKNFSLVGDDGTTTDIVSASGGENVKIIRESDNVFGVWCSGRQSCLSMFVQLKFLKRQDLIGIVSGLMKPLSNDQIIISVEFDRKDLDSYVFCLANRKITQALMRDYQDIGAYCLEKKQLGEKYDLSSKYAILNEIGEIPSVILDSRVCAFINKYPDLIEYLLISDQYVGYKILQDDQQNVQNKAQTVGPNGEIIEPTLGLQNSRSMMIICINIPKSSKYSITNEDIEKVQPALLFAFYLIDKLPRVLLSKEAKGKAIKRRKEITELNMKAVNKQRQEALQQKKEEKRRAEKERILNETDPDKQKKLEEKEAKREKKRSQGKLKQVKIKSM